MKLPVIIVNQPDAEDAYEVHKALVEAEKSNPKLARNARWQCMRMDAYEAFCDAFSKAD